MRRSRSVPGSVGQSGSWLVPAVGDLCDRTRARLGLGLGLARHEMRINVDQV